MEVFIDKKATERAKSLYPTIRSALTNEKIELRIGNALWHVEAHIQKTLVGEEAKIIFWLKAPDELVEDIIIINANGDGTCRSIAVSDCLLSDGTFKLAVLATIRFQAQALALDREAKLMNGTNIN